MSGTELISMIAPMRPGGLISLFKYLGFEHMKHAYVHLDAFFVSMLIFVLPVQHIS